jgi:serine protease
MRIKKSTKFIGMGLVLFAVGVSVPLAIQHTALLAADSAATQTNGQPIQIQSGSQATLKNALKIQEAVKATQSVLDVKLTENSGIRLRGHKLVLTPGADTSQLDQLNAVLAKYPVQSMKKIFDGDEAALDQQQTDLSAKSGKKLHNLNTWLEIQLSSDSAAAAATDLSSLPVVDSARQKQALIDTTTADMTAFLGHHFPAPNGLDARYALTSGIPGARGQNVKVVDIERGWNLHHEDLTKLAAPNVMIGPASTDTDDDHGTAAIGIVLADDNGFGVTGMAPDASVGLRAVTGPNDFTVAAQSMSPGDILFSPQGVTYVKPDGTLGGSVPLEYDQSYYDAISAVAASGIIVVEPAGNGGQNLDSSAFAPMFGPNGRPNSGAIMVGAGIGDNPACPADYGPVRSASPWTYGSRVDVQGFGTCVTTTGYGYANPSAPKNSRYDYDFQGTSSASAIIAGAAAELSSAFEANNGRPATIAEVKALLKYNASPQDTTSPGAEYPDHNVGSLPNLKAGLDKIVSDAGGTIGGGGTSTVPAPTNLTAKNNPNGSVGLSWSAPSGFTPARYLVFRGTTQVASQTGRSFTDTDAPADTALVYTIKAQDATGTNSDASTPATITTAIVADGFESGTFNKWPAATNMSILTTGGYNGNKGAQASSPTGAGASATAVFPTTKTDVYYRTMVKFTSSDTNNVNILNARTAAGTIVVSLNRSGNGYISYFNNVANSTTTSTATPLAIGTWYDVQMHVIINGASSLVEVWVNGTKIDSLTKTQNLGAAPLGKVEIGDSHTGRNFVTVYDNVVASNSFVQ